MGKSCLNKLASGITVGCIIPQVGVKAIYLMHAGDVTFSYSPSGLLIGVVFAGGAKSYKVEGYKQNIQVTASLKTTDVSARVDSSVTFKIPNNDSNRGTNGILNVVALGRFYVLAVFNDGDNMILGDVSPLECSSVDFDSNANARLATITLASPEGSAGNSARVVTNEVATTIISKSV